MTLSIAYFPPIEYFAVLAKYSSVYVEAFENYQKQSYRNRCRILTSSGVETLNFPVVHGQDLFRTLITSVEVDYTTPWVDKTIKAVETAYGASPFFIYYRDELFSILESKPVCLWDLDMQIIRFFCSKIGITTEIVPTERFMGDALDIHPKRESGFRGRSYWQVFNGLESFVPNLSVMDLLFNEGPESICYLR